MNRIEEAPEFEELRKVVEGICEVADEDQLKAPAIDEVAEELDTSHATVRRWADGDYNHAARTAGYIPNRGMNIGDFMAVYDKLGESEDKVTKRVVEEKAPISPVGQWDNNITHAQLREKHGIELNELQERNRKGKENENPFPGKIYGDEEENLEYKIRGVIFRYLEDENRVPSDTELTENVGYREFTGGTLREIADFHADPAVAEGKAGILSAARENHIFDFWVDEYLDVDWTGYQDIEVDMLMDLKMNDEDIKESELNAVARKYSKWVDFSRYSRR